MQNEYVDGKRIPVLLAEGETATSGAGFLKGDIFGVALQSGVAGDTVRILISGAVAGVAKDNTQAFTQGAKLYWNAAASKLTTTASGNNLVGYAFKDAAADAETATIRLMF